MKQYTLNVAIEPTNVNPATYYLSEDTFIVKAVSSYTYSSKINRHNLTIDNSVTPGLHKYTTTMSTDTEPLILQENTLISSVVQSVLKIEVSGRDLTYIRSYLQLSDAFSYIGGMYSFLLPAAILINIFN